MLEPPFQFRDGNHVVHSQGSNEPNGPWADGTVVILEDGTDFRRFKSR